MATLTILDGSKVNVALPSFERALGTGPTELQVIVTGYMLAYGILLVPAGRLGDIWSRKAMFVCGLAAFCVASVVCTLAPTALVLIVGRLLQGVSAAMLMPQVFGQIQAMFIGPARSRAFGIFGAVIGIGTALGPTLAGFFIDLGGPSDGWRLIFAMNIPLGLLLLPLAVIYLPSDRAARATRASLLTLDIVGVAILAVATLTFMIPLALTTGRSTDNPLRWLWLLLTAIAAVAFWWWERRYSSAGKTPVLDFAMISRPSFRYGLLIGTTYFAVMPGVMIAQTIYLQQGLGYAAMIAGMVTIPLAVGSAITSVVFSRFFQEYGLLLILIGMTFIGAGVGLSLLCLLAPPTAAAWIMAAALSLAGLGSGIVLGPNQVKMLEDVPVQHASVAGSVAQVGQRIGGAIGVAVGTSILFMSTSAMSQPTAADFGRGLLAATATSLIILAIGMTFTVLDIVAARRRS